MSDDVRLLVDLDDKSIEVLPDYHGPVEGDTLLEVAVARHVHPDGTPHMGHLMRVERKHWESPSTRAAIEKQIIDGAGWTGLDPAFYAAKDQFSADAMTCWQAHKRTRDCSDYRSESKVLLPATIGLRREVARATGHDDIARSAPRQYLCSFCPVQSLVDHVARKRAGAYN